MTRIALVLVLGVLLAGWHVGTVVMARVSCAVNQSQSEACRAKAHGLGRVSQLLGGGSHSATGVDQVHVRSVARTDRGAARCVVHQGVC